MPFFLLMLAGVAAGYYAGIAILERTKKAGGDLVPIATAVIGGMAGYWIALTFAPPIPTGDIVWAEPVRQVYDQAELDAVLAEDTNQLTLVDFYADYCPPCHQEAPSLNELAILGDRIVVVNVERSPSLADRYDIVGLPTVLIFKDGKEVHRAMGYHSKRALKNILSSGLGS